jgi:hypothetical protein
LRHAFPYQNSRMTNRGQPKIQAPTRAGKIAAMMVGSEFPGDNNRTLMDVQHSVYGEMVVRLLTGPRDRCLAAASLLRVDDK